MSYIQSVLQPGETVIRIGKIHWIAYVPGALVLIAAAYLAYDAAGPHTLLRFAPKFEWPIVYVVLAGAFILLFRSWFRQWTTEIGVTDRRVIQKSGFISRKTAEMNIHQVERVEVNQSILGRIFDYGSIQIHGSGQGLEGLENVAEPLALRTSITAR